MNRAAEFIASVTTDLPTLPQVAWQAMELVKDPATSAVDLERVISRDQALAARVLKISNSALYGMRGTISSLSRAIVILGFKTVHSLVVAAASESLYRTKNFKDRLLWEHALGVAMVSRKVALKCRYPDREEAFMAGLMHDIGKTAMDLNLGENYQKVIQMVYNDGWSFLDAENEMLGFDHTEVGSLLVKKWNFSPVLQEAVHLHHHPARAVVAPQLCAIVHLANAVCMKLSIGPEKRPEIELADLESVQMLGLTDGELNDLLAEVTEQLASEGGSESL